MSVHVVTDSTFDHDVINEKDKVVLVDFWAEWCGPCRMLAPVIDSVSNRYGDQAKFYKLDTESNSDTAQKYKITGIPCVIVFKNGQEVGRMVGYKSESAFETELKQYL